MKVLCSPRTCFSSSARVQPSSAEGRCAGEPRLDPLGRLVRLERVDEVAEQEGAAGREQGGDTGERDPLPEVRQMVQRVPRVHELRRLAAVLVREEAGLDALDVREAGRRN